MFVPFLFSRSMWVDVFTTSVPLFVREDSFDEEVGDEVWHRAVI